MDNRLALMCGIDLPFPPLQLSIHQPTIKEIAMIGESDFFTGIQCLSINKSALSEANSDLLTISNFQIFMTVMTDKSSLDKKKAVQQVLALMFPDYHAALTPLSFLLTNKDGAKMIDETNFNDLQEIIRIMFCLKNQETQQLGFNPVNDKAREIAEKLMKNRQRVAELNGTANSSVLSQYLSTLTVGLGSMSLQELSELTMFQLFDLLERYQLYINWDIDIRSRLAGADIKERPINWMKNIH